MHELSSCDIHGARQMSFNLDHSRLIHSLSSQRCAPASWSMQGIASLIPDFEQRCFSGTAIVLYRKCKRHGYENEYCASWMRCGHMDPRIERAYEETSREEVYTQRNETLHQILTVSALKNAFGTPIFAPFRALTFHWLTSLLHVGYSPFPAVCSSPYVPSSSNWPPVLSSARGAEHTSVITDALVPHSCFSYETNCQFARTQETFPTANDVSRAEL